MGGVSGRRSRREGEAVLNFAVWVKRGQVNLSGEEEGVLLEHSIHSSRHHLFIIRSNIGSRLLQKFDRNSDGLCFVGPDACHIHAYRSLQMTLQRGARI